MPHSSYLGEESVNEPFHSVKINCYTRFENNIFGSCLCLFREIDRDGDGRVSYKDFEYMMKYSMENGF